MLELFLAWAIVSLFLGSLSVIVGKKFGVELTIGAFAGLVVIANIIAGKMIMIGPFMVPAAVLVYSTTFLITDILSEKWSEKEARKAVWAGFLANIILVVAIAIAVSWPVAKGSIVSQETFNAVFNLTPRVVLASMIAYLVSQNHDVWAFNWWKKKTRGKYLWLRNNASTIVSQGIDSFLFISIAFYGLMSNDILLTVIAGQWIVKVAIAILDTPFCYLACQAIDKMD
ncbi:MAG: queuosine precursor transporter [Candidatus Diapherotrites archaeon]|nr:queuosine precursor transporter [Candidatus Diapherotrites archaeon]